MLSAKLMAADNKLSCYVMHIHMFIDFKIFAKELDMEPSPIKLTARSFLTYTKDVSRKLMITGLSLENQILHFIIYKVLFPRAINFYTNCG